MRLPILAGTTLVVGFVASQRSRSFLFPEVQIIDFENHLEHHRSGRVLSIKFTKLCEGLRVANLPPYISGYAYQHHFSPWQTQEVDDNRSKRPSGPFRRGIYPKSEAHLI